MKHCFDQDFCFFASNGKESKEEKLHFFVINEVNKNFCVYEIKFIFVLYLYGYTGKYVYSVVMRKFNNLI